MCSSNFDEVSVCFMFFGCCMPLTIFIVLYVFILSLFLNYCINFPTDADASHTGITTTGQFGPECKDNELFQISRT